MQAITGRMDAAYLSLSNLLPVLCHVDCKIKSTGGNAMGDFIPVFKHGDIPPVPDRTAYIQEQLDGICRVV